MFPQQIAENPRKRGRDDDADDANFGNGPLSFAEHRNKQTRLTHMPLPLRASPPRPQKAASPKSHFSQWTSSPAASPGLHQPRALMMQDDADTDMLESHLAPGSMQPDLLAHPNLGVNISGRMPTPIQPTFATQVQGMVVDMSTVPRTVGDAHDWAQNRRLPSPISEGEDGPTSPGMILDNTAAPFHQHRDDHDHMHGYPDGETMDGAMLIEEGAMEIEGSVPATSSPPKKGHTRSRHTLNSWTWKPGMKRSFSIGYRADCEKCRLKVPGHFNHIIIS